MDPNQPAPNTIYNQLNNNPNVIPPQIPVQVPNNNQGFSQGSSIYSQVGPQPTGNIYSQASGNIYSAQENNLGLEPKISGNIYLPPPENNIGIQPQVNGNIYIPPPENNPPIAPQVNIEQNNYVPPLINAELPPINNPQNNLPPLNAQISGEVNSPYGLQANVNIYTPPPTVDIVPPTTVSPVTLNAENGPTSTAPLIPPQVSTINTSGGCCGDSSVAEVEGSQRNTILIFSVALILTSLINLIIGLTIDSSSEARSVVICVDLGLVFYGVIIALSIFRNRCLRILGTAFSVIFLIAGIIGFVVEYVLTNDIHHNDKGSLDFMGVLFFVRAFILLILVNRVFFIYWGINCCNKRSSYSNGETYSNNYYNDTHYSGGINVHLSSPHHHHHSPPHHSAPHHAPHHSAPHHAPHHSAPHHAPHHSAPHHSAHRSGGGHHGGGGRGHGRH
ncbi:MAG: tetraspanin family protein [Acholeplasmatales bacterium]|nr:tetraspanin family protein [Acholeplasmatales bacterium]